MLVVLHSARFELAVMLFTTALSQPPEYFLLERHKNAPRNVKRSTKGPHVSESVVPICRDR